MKLTKEFFEGKIIYKMSQHTQSGKLIGTMLMFLIQDNRSYIAFILRSNRRALRKEIEKEEAAEGK